VIVCPFRSTSPSRIVNARQVNGFVNVTLPAGLLITMASTGDQSSRSIDTSREPVKYHVPDPRV